MIIPDILLADPGKNKVLVDILHEIDRRLDEVKIVSSTPTVNTDRSAIMYDRTNKQLLISDTSEWRRVATEAI